MVPDQSLLTKSIDVVGDGAGRAPSSLPITLLRQAARRLKIVTLVMVCTMIVIWVGVNLVEGVFLDEFRRPGDWIPPVAGIIVSLLVFSIARSVRLSPLTIVNVGLAYEVAVAYSIAFGQYWNAFRGIDGGQLTPDVVGISAVALWMAFFTVIVPARPRNALVALLLSGSAVPVTVAWFIQTGNAPGLPPMDFFSIFVLPYLITVFMCLIAANIIYGLGRDVRRAQRMGSYHLLDVIGRGGMGEVWRARHDLLARPAAIKVIRRDALGADLARQHEVLARFEQEAQVTSGLESPHTVALYDFGMSEDGSLFYVMELLNGVDLQSLVERFGPLPPERVAFILRQVCSSLGEAHLRGLVHRDIKPANILLCKHALEHDFVKVLDFGLVKRITEMNLDAQGGAAMTRADVVAGTPAFLAPEIATGKGKIDGRADFYSLGCVAFWLLAGRQVFQEESPLATIVAHTSQAPPSVSSCTEMPVPAEIEDLVMACLAKRPPDRPDSAEALITRLDAIEFDTPWSGERALRWWETHHPVETVAGELGRESKLAVRS